MAQIAPARARLRIALSMALVFVLPGLFGSATAAELSPPLQWSRQFVTPLAELASGVAVDPDGNILFSTWHEANPNTNELPAAALQISRFDSTGELVWQKSFPALDSTIAPTASRLLTGTNGDLLMALSSTNASYHFGTNVCSGVSLARLDSGGNVLWAEGQGSGRGSAPLITMDSEGNSVMFAAVKGFFKYRAFEVSAGDADLVLLKVAPDGTLIAARRGVAAPSSQARGLAVDPAGSIYAAGNYQGSIAFGAVLTNNVSSATNGFVVKFDKDGQPLWLRDLRGDGNVQIGGMALLNDGSIAIVGYFENGISLGVQKVPGSSSFLGRVEPDGVFRTIYKIAERLVPSELILGPDGELVTAGTFSGNVVLAGATLATRGGRDCFVAKLSTTGVVRWAKPFGYVSDDSFDGQLAMAPFGEICLAFSARDGVILDNAFVEGGGGSDAVLFKLSAPAQPLPIFLALPAPQATLVGGSATFTAFATNALRYQWYFNNLPLAGETNTSYTIRNAVPNQAGLYSVAALNGAGTTRSVAAELSVSGGLRVTVTTFAGKNTPGYVDATNSAAVRFNQPNGLAYWTSGIMAVADTSNHVVRLVDPSGATVTYAGIAGKPGYLDGPATLAQFRFPLGLAVAPSTDILLADTENNVLRRISSIALRSVSTAAGRTLAGYRDGPASIAQFNSPAGIAMASDGAIFVTDLTNHVVRRISVDGLVKTWVGNGLRGSLDAEGTNASFNLPFGIAADAEGNLFVTERGNHTIRKISPTRQVTTLAGGLPAGFADGSGAGARFNSPAGIATDPNGNLYVADQKNHAIRRVDARGNVLTVAGVGTAGFQDGARNQAMFNSPTGVMLHRNGSLYVSDTMNHCIRRIDLLNEPIGIGPHLSYTLQPPALVIEGATGSTYRIETADPSAGTNTFEWRAVATLTLRADVENWLDPDPPEQRTKFFRLVRVP